MKDLIKKELELLSSYGNIGFFSFCKITLILLQSKDNPKEIMNYFCYIEFNSKYTGSETLKYLTEKPLSILKSTYRLAIIEYVVKSDVLAECYIKAYENNIWEIGTDIIRFDNLFYTKYKYVPEFCPFSRYGDKVPVEWGLHGSNCSGNYYVHELFSDKKEIYTNLSKESVLDINNKVKKIVPSINLSYLDDRIGNIVCKFPVETIYCKPLLLGEHGIHLTFKQNESTEKNIKYIYQLIQEYDKVVYTNEINSNYNLEDILIERNELKNTIFIIDSTTNLINYAYSVDLSKKSTNFSEMGLQENWYSSNKERILNINGETHNVTTIQWQKRGILSQFKENIYIGLRQMNRDNEYLDKMNYLKSYVKDEHEKALADIKNIINNNPLRWDLGEICILDPYIMPIDMAKTVFFSNKRNIDIKAICEHSKAKNMADANKEITLFKKMITEQINEILGENTDINLEYRTVYEHNGYSFHDRYLILKFNINNPRVWSLGTSINSVGKQHHIIQIIDNPNLIVKVFDDLWENTNVDNCILFKNS